MLPYIFVCVGGYMFLVGYFLGKSGFSKRVPDSYVYKYHKSRDAGLVPHYDYVSFVHYPGNFDGCYDVKDYHDFLWLLRRYDGTIRRILEVSDNG